MSKRGAQGSNERAVRQRHMNDEYAVSGKALATFMSTPAAAAMDEVAFWACLVRLSASMSHPSVLKLATSYGCITSRIDKPWFADALVASAAHLKSLDIDAGKELRSLLSNVTQLMDKMPQLSEQLCDIKTKVEMMRFLDKYRGRVMTEKRAKLRALAAALQ